MEFNENNAIEVSNVRDIPTITEEIKGLCNQFANITLAFGVEIGRRLTEAKQLLDHGQWGKWLEENFEFSQRTANNMMKLFDEYGAAQITLFGAVTNSQTFANLTAVKALKLLALEPSERENFAQENDVENMSVRALEKAIKEKKEAEKQIEELNEEMDILARQTVTLQKENNQLEDENSELRTALADVKENTSALEKVQKELIAAEDEKTALASELAKAKEAEKKAKEKLQEIKDNPQISDEDLARITAEAEAKAAEAHKEAIEQAKTKADERIAEAVKARFDAEEALTEARRQKEELEKKIKMMSPEMINFKSAFENLQDGIGKMIAAFRELSPEYAEKFRPAVYQLKEKITV